MLTSELRQVPLQNLRDGSEYPLGNINMRKDGGTSDLGPLKASLRESGQLQNMVGTTYGEADEVFLIIGNRRRRASEANQDESPSLSLNNMDVRVYANLTVEQAMEIALAEEITKLPPHEVDQYEAFAALGNQDPREIAAHFDCSERLVRQRMKLGRLSAKVRQAWRDGEINRQTAEAFTMGKDSKAQDRAFEKLKRNHSLFPNAVRGMLLGDQEGVPRLLRFASAEFVAAGGEIITDLFEDDHAVSDPALLKQVADKLLEDKVSFYTGLGFAWSALAADLPAEWESWPRLKIRPADPRSETVTDLDNLKAIIDSESSTIEERRAARVEKKRIESWLLEKAVPEKKRGETGVVVVGIDGDGGVDLVIGISRPETEFQRVLEDQTISKAPPDKSPSVVAGKAAEPEAVPRLSRKGQDQRALELTDAAAEVLAKNPALAVIVLLAGFADRTGYGAIRASVTGAGANALRLMDSDVIADNIPRLAKMKPVMLNKLLAQAAAASLTFQAHSAEHPAIEDKGVKAVIALLPPKDLGEALRRHFNPEDYFGKSLPKELALGAIQENCGQNVFEDQRAVTSATDLRAFAQANIKPDWLPPELRGPGYAGPGAKKKTVPKATKATGKPSSKKKSKGAQ